MKIVKEFPPIYDKIKEKFTLSGREIFAWGDIIYNPGGGELGPELVAHEEVHKKQQGDDIEGWWEKYLADDNFRFKQELEAHQMEYKEFCKLNKDRNIRHRYLVYLGGRLSSPVYGSMVSQMEAIKSIRNK
jgi:hypothetical protein